MLHVVVVSNSQDPNKMYATSSYPMMKLWKDQMLCMGLHPKNQVRTGVDKFPFLFHETFEVQSRKIDKIVIVKVVSDTKACKIRKLKGAESMVSLSNQIYRKDYLHKIEFLACLPLLASILNSVSCYEIRRPLFQSTENELVNLLVF